MFQLTKGHFDNEELFDGRPWQKECEEVPEEDMRERIDKFEPVCEKAKEMWQVLQKDMKIDKLIAVEVDHCFQSYGCLLVAEENFGAGNKILYSGDTRPCVNLVNYAHNCTLLIHEATFSDDMEEEARLRRHTTTKQAIAVVDKI